MKRSTESRKRVLRLIEKLMSAKHYVQDEIYGNDVKDRDLVLTKIKEAIWHATDEDN